MLPTQTELDQAAEAFDRDWGVVDEVLYGICRAHPGHAVRREVTAKVALVDRAYSAGLERQVIPDEGSQAITKIADFVADRAADVDAVIAGLAGLREPLDGEAMAEIVQAHGCFVDLLRRIPTRGTPPRSPRSFAAKYLHFHCPVVPIYDSHAADRLVKLVHWDSLEKLVEQPSATDAVYWDFCVRFFRLYDSCQKADLEMTVKLLDTYLWQVPTTH
jgi:hypothetical protein